MLRAFSSSRALAPRPRVMGEFATIVLGLGLISLGAALLAHVIPGVQLPPGITEIAITVLAIAGRALLAQTKRHAGREDKPPQIDTEPPDAPPNGAPGDPQQPGNLPNRHALSSHVGNP